MRAEKNGLYHQVGVMPPIDDMFDDQLELSSLDLLLPLFHAQQCAAAAVCTAHAAPVAPAVFSLVGCSRYCIEWSRESTI